MPPRELHSPASITHIPFTPPRGPALRRFIARPKRSLNTPLNAKPLTPPKAQAAELPIAEKARAFSMLLDTSKLELAQDVPEALTRRRHRVRVPKRAVQIVGVLAIGVLLWFVYGRSSIHISEFSADNFTLSVPSQYEQTETLGATTFKERGGSDDKRSMIFVLEPTSSAGLGSDFSSNDAIAANFNLVGQTLPQTLQSYIGQNSSIEQVQIDKTSHNGDNAFLLHAKVLLGGKESGQVSALVTYHNTGIYTLAVYANNSDHDLAKASKHILDTFSIHAADPTLNTP